MWFLLFPNSNRAEMWIHQQLNIQCVSNWGNPEGKSFPNSPTPYSLVSRGSSELASVQISAHFHTVPYLWEGGSDSSGCLLAQAWCRWSALMHVWTQEAVDVLSSKECNSSLGKFCSSLDTELTGCFVSLSNDMWPVYEFWPTLVRFFFFWCRKRSP